MYKIAAFALSSALGCAGMAHTSPVEAHACPPVLIAPYGYAPAYSVPGPYYWHGQYWHGRYWHRDVDRDRFERWDRR